MQIDWQQIRRLLVIFVADIEIELNSLNSKLQTIRELTNAEITLLLSSQLFPLPTSNFPLVDRLIPYTTTWQDPTQEKELVKKLSQFGFDAAIILTNNFEQSPYPFAYLTYLAGIPIRIGRSSEFGGGVINYQLSIINYQLTVNS